MMAEELTSTVSTPQAPSTLAEQAQPASRPEPQQQTVATERPTQTGSGNWQDDPKFKEYQRSYNKALEAERQERKRLEQQAQQRIAQLEQQLEQFATRDMDEGELAKRERIKLEQRLQQQQQEYQQLYQNYAKDLAKSEIARRAGVPVDIFSDVESPDDAWELALQTRIEQVKAQMEAEYKERLASNPANMPDMGAGKPTSTVTDLNSVKFKSNTDLRETYRRLWDEYSR